MSAKETVSEKDKPFIIALMFVVGFFALIFAGLLAINYGNPYMEAYIDKVLGGILSIVGTVVAFYFGTKTSNNK